MKQSFKKVKVKLTVFDLELSREGYKPDDVIEADREYINGKPRPSVWFGSRSGTAKDCVAYIGVNCRLIKT